MGHRQWSPWVRVWVGTKIPEGYLCNCLLIVIRMVTMSCLAQKGGVHEQWLHSPHSCESADCPDTVPITMGELTGTKSHLPWVAMPFLRL